MEISQEDLKLLLEQVRELTSRVHRLEQSLHVAAEPSVTRVASVEEEKRPAQSGPTPSIPASRQTLEPAPPVPPPPPLPSLDTVVFAPVAGARERNWESRIGTQWLNRIGIAAVLIGVALSLNYAFENKWIGPVGRIAIGLLAGIAVVIWSERFRSRGYRIFSYSLKAVGIGAIYLSLWASFQVYHLIPAEMVFLSMVVVTAATCVMALTQDAEILAVYAITGGFSTPVLLSTGANREIVLFSYVLLLDLGILALVAFKPWRRLLWLGYAGTLTLYLGWYLEYYNRKQIEPTLIFATLFFLIFAIAPLLMLRQEKGAGTMPLALALVNAAAYFLQSYEMISELSITAMAWFSLVLAGVYLGLNRLRPRASEPAGEHNLRLMHLALAVGLITVAIPIRLEAHWITIGWFVEAALLLWVGDRIHLDLLNIFALAALALGIVRLIAYDNFGQMAVILNMRILVYAIAVCVLGLVAYMASKRSDQQAQGVAAIAIVSLNLLALTALSLEVRDYYSRELNPIVELPIYRPHDFTQIRSISTERDFTYSALFMGYGAMLMIIGFWRRSAFVRWQALILIAATTIKVFVYDTSQLDRIYRILSFVALGVLLLTISFAYQKDWLKLSTRRSEGQTSP